MTLRSAYAAYQAGRLDDAEQQLVGWLRQRPYDAMGLHLAAMVALDRGDLDAAHHRIEAALTDPTNRHEKLNIRGKIWQRIGRELAAQDAFRASLDNKPDYTAARINLARLEFSRGQADEAAQHFADVVRHDPGNEAAWQSWFVSLLESQQLDAAESVLDEAPFTRTKERGFRARVQVYRGDYDQAFETAKAGIDDPVRGEHSAFLALKLLWLTSRWDEARPLIDDMLKRRPERAGLWAAAIRGLFKADQVAEARTLLSDAPDSLPVRMLRLEMLIAAQAYREAFDFAQQALEVTPGHGGLMKHLCTAALGCGEFDTAQIVADLGLRAKPNDQFYYAIKVTAGRAKGQNYRYYYDYERFVRSYDIDPPEGWATIEAFNSDLRDALDRLHNFDTAPLDQTLRLGTQTAPNLRHVDDPVIRALFEAINPAIHRYLNDIGGDDTHPLLRRKAESYRVQSSWSVRLQGGGHHVNHVHSGGWISLVYYVDVPEGRGEEGWIKFGEPPEPLATVLGHGPEFEIEPRPGRIVAFPSYIWHGTYPTQGEDTRMTLPMDIVPARR